MERERGSGKEWNKGDVEWGTGEERGRVRGGMGDKRERGRIYEGRRWEVGKANALMARGKGCGRYIKIILSGTPILI